MASRRAGWAGAVALAALMTACDAIGPSPVPTRFTGVLPLPSAIIDTEGCPGVGLGDDAVLAGDPNDPRVAWVEHPLGRVDVDFAPWLGARFVPTLEIVDANGQTIARAGDPVEGACSMGDGRPLLVLWSEATSSDIEQR